MWLGQRWCSHAFLSPPKSMQIRRCNAESIDDQKAQPRLRTSSATVRWEAIVKSWTKSIWNSTEHVPIVWRCTQMCSVCIKRIKHIVPPFDTASLTVPIDTSAPTSTIASIPVNFNIPFRSLAPLRRSTAWCTSVCVSATDPTHVYAYDVEDHCLEYAHVCRFGRLCNNQSALHWAKTIHIVRSSLSVRRQVQETQSGRSFEFVQPSERRGHSKLLSSTTIIVTIVTSWSIVLQYRHRPTREYCGIVRYYGLNKEITLSQKSM